MANGPAPAFGKAEKLQRDPHFRDHLLFPRVLQRRRRLGVGASHQTDWTGLSRKLLQQSGRLTCA